MLHRFLFASRTDPHGQLLFRSQRGRWMKSSHGAYFCAWGIFGGWREIEMSRCWFHSGRWLSLRSRKRCTPWGRCCWLSWFRRGRRCWHCFYGLLWVTWGVPCEDDSLVVEQVVQFSTVNLVERDPNIKLVVTELFKNVLCCQKVQSPDWMTISQHRISLTRSCLTVCEASNLRSVKCALD